MDVISAAGGIVGRSGRIWTRGVGAIVALSFLLLQAAPVAAADHGPAGTITDGLYAIVCQPGVLLIVHSCSPFSGAYGAGQLRGCSSAPVNPGTPNRAFWDAFNTPDAFLYDGTVARPASVDSVPEPVRGDVDDLGIFPAKVWDGTRGSEAGPISDPRVCQAQYRHVDATARAVDEALFELSRRS